MVHREVSNRQYTTLTFTYKTPAANTTIPDKKVPHLHNNRINESVIEEPTSVFSNNVEPSVVISIVIVGVIINTVDV